ncbi:HTTM domain-containing protein [Kordiimonas aestuarii]|uniref:HTTM domain-containing protein n=1 Tax=Kordiimonas aestuarii TaxID=1005925 RepID=UPI0021D359FE|nr:HTTM domain-containing protein [Kordiimonas aestuarii]
MVKGRLRDWQQRLFAPVDGASLAVFRVLFGAVILYEAWRYETHNWIEDKFLFPAFRFSYHGFGWVEPLPPALMLWVTKLLAICAFLVMVGLFFRVAAMGLFLLFSYIFLLDKAQYLNHFYFTILLAFILAVIPANRVWSLDRMLGRVSGDETMPGWSQWLARGQMEIMLLWAGLVKLNSDWLNGLPLRDWLARDADKFPGVIADMLRAPDFGVYAAWAAAALHIIGAPLLLVPGVRGVVFFVYAGFHISNHFLWQIGIFPWLTIVGTLLFLDASWPRRVAGLVSHRPVILPVRRITLPAQPLVTVFVCVWLGSQALLPLRPYLYSGNVAWNEQGHRFSWRMKLRDKEGEIAFRVVDPRSERSWKVDLDDFLDGRQVRKMVARPDMILEFAHHLRDHWRRRYAVRDAQVFVKSFVSANGRPMERFIAPELDLARVERTFLVQDDWIEPYSEDRKQKAIP